MRENLPEWQCTQFFARLICEGLGVNLQANQEGRTITLEYPDFWVVATYVPNSGDKLQRLDFRTQVWDKRLQEYLKSLESSGKPVRSPPLLFLHLPSPPPPPLPPPPPPP